MTIYQVDAFTNKLFGGNPAAVVPLEAWLDTGVMQQLAMENNLSETVFFMPAVQPGADYDIRWFTPAYEIDLCGHATMASAFVLYEVLGFSGQQLVFASKSGLLKIKRAGSRYIMDFPSWKPERVADYPAVLRDVLGDVSIAGVYQKRDLLVELEHEEDVLRCSPDFTLMKKHFSKMIITAPGKSADFVSRFFAPDAGVDEDPVTGSAHAQLIPFWSEKLGKDELFALQLSARGGRLWCRQLNPDRVEIAGECVLYMKGEFFL